MVVRYCPRVIRLADIDAPELSQTCKDGPKELRRCGEHVAGILANRIRGQSVRCDVLELDDYDRRIARCEHHGEDLSAWLVGHGWAMAYPPLLDAAFGTGTASKYW